MKLDEKGTLKVNVHNTTKTLFDIEFKSFLYDKNA